MTPRFGDRRADRSGTGLEGASVESGHIGSGEGDFDTDGWLVRSGGNDVAIDVRLCHGVAGEGEAGGAGFEFAIGIGTVLLEETAGEGKGGFVEGERFGDVSNVEDDIAECNLGRGHRELIQSRTGTN